MLAELVSAIVAQRREKAGSQAFGTQHSNILESTRRQLLDHGEDAVIKEMQQLLQQASPQACKVNSTHQSSFRMSPRSKHHRGLFSLILIGMHTATVICYLVSGVACLKDHYKIEGQLSFINKGSFAVLRLDSQSVQRQARCRLLHLQAACYCFDRSCFNCLEHCFELLKAQRLKKLQSALFVPLTAAQVPSAVEFASCIDLLMLAPGRYWPTGFTSAILQPEHAHRRWFAEMPDCVPDVRCHLCTFCACRFCKQCSRQSERLHHSVATSPLQTWQAAGNFAWHCSASHAHGCCRPQLMTSS